MNIRRSLGTFLALVFILSCGAYAASASARLGPPAGTLDASFGTGGKVITDFGLSDVPQAAAAQSDGKILVGGVLQDPTTFGTQFAIARYLLDGSLDTSFGAGGRTVVSFGGSESIGSDLAVQQDGKIVLTGIATLADPSSGADFALARFNPDGSLDSGFGAGGMLTTDFGDTHDVGLSVVLQPDGKIVVAGGTRHFGVRASNPYDFALARYNANGSLDTSFGAGGHTSTDFGGFDNVATGVALQPDGKIVATGTGFDPGSGSSPPELELARYNTDGSLDPTFDADGRVMLGSAEGSDVAVVRGKIVAAGRSGNNIALFRYDGAGSLDRTFGHDGIAMAILPEYALADELAIQPDGEIVVAGSSASNGGDFAVARFNPDGSVDPAFGARGAATTDLQGNSYEWAGGLVLERDGKIVLAGPTVAPGSSVADFALVRYLGAACVVPNIKQRALAAARKAIAKANCTLGKVRRAFSARVKTGHVISQKPAAGRRLRYGAKVRLVVSRGRR